MATRTKVIVVCTLLALCGCKNHHDHGCQDTISITAYVDDTNNVNVIVSLPYEHYGFIYLAPDGTARTMVVASGEVNLGHFEPGDYEVCIVLYLASARPPDDYDDGNTYPYPYPHYDDHDDGCNHSGQIYCTNFTVSTL